MLWKNSDRTNSVQKENYLKPILFRASTDITMKLVNETLTKFEFEKISVVSDFHEIYAKKNGLEYTFTFVEDFGKTILTILLYSEKKSFKLKKFLKEIAIYIRENLSEYIEN